MNQTMSEEESRRRQHQATDASVRKSRFASIFKYACIYTCSLVAFLAFVEFSGIRGKVNQYLNLATLDPSVVSTRVASLKNTPRGEGLGQELELLGVNFRTDPRPVHSLGNITSIPNQSARLLVTEIQAANAGEVIDWEGGCPDWIELWNPGDQPFNATGWFLTDKLSKPGKWQIPTLVLSPNERVLVFASGLDLSDEDELHTNFRLAKSGESLHLVRPDQKTVEQTIAIGIPGATHGVSYGPSPTDPQPLLYPTPLEANAPVAIGFTAPVTCSQASCLHDTDFTITLACETPDTVIRYTTDGSIPEEQNSEIYEHPLTISHTTVLRARAFAEKRFRSAVLTRSFLRIDDLANQTASPDGFPSQWNKTKADYEMDPRITEKHNAEIRATLKSLPMVSVVASKPSLFGKTGIYSNSWNRGQDWEVPAVMELIPNRDEKGFQAPCGLRVAGFESRRPDWKKHSLRLSFRARYGLSVVEQQIFESRKVDGPNEGTGPCRAPGVTLEENEDKLVDASHGLKSSKTKRFEGVVTGDYGDKNSKYLWTIDKRGINVIQESTAFPTPRGYVVHTNLSRNASLGGEAWFESPDTVSINPNSGRFGKAAGITREQWCAAIRYWEKLGYKVKPVPDHDSSSSLMLRSTDDSWASHRRSVRVRAQYMRDEWTRMTGREMGHLAVRGRFVHVCLNGLYWGLYNLVERPDEEYLAHELGGKEDEFITMRSRDTHIDTDEAGELVWNTITELANGDLTDPTQFARLEEKLDIINLIDYCLIHMYTGNEDWALINGNNMRAYLRRQQDSKLKFILWDGDSTFASGWQNKKIDYPLPLEEEGDEGSFVELFRQLMKSEKFRQMFAARVNKWCREDGVLGAAACQQRYESLLRKVEPALIAESARWGDIHSQTPFTPMKSWETQKQRMLQEWFPNRTRLMLNELKLHGLTSDTLPTGSQNP